MSYHGHVMQVIGVAKKSEAGFTGVICTVEGLEEYIGHQVRVQAKNENYVVHKLDVKGEELDMLACTPDLISILDSNTGMWRATCCQVAGVLIVYLAL